MNIFEQLSRMAESCIEVCSVLGHCDFRAQTFEVWWDIFTALLKIYC